MIDPSINFVVERLYRQALAEIRVENPQRAIGHTKALEIRAIGHTQWRRPAKLQCLASLLVQSKAQLHPQTSFLTTKVA